MRHPDRRLDRARRSVGLSFAVNGFAFATWVSRIPELRATLDLDNAHLGLLLLCLSLGSLSGLPAAGSLIARLGPAAVVRLGTLLDGVGLAAVAVGGLLLGSLPLTAAGLLLFGVGTGIWDVAMNVEAADVERRLGRTIMPRFHAGFSLGTVLGAGVGAFSLVLRVPGEWHLGVGAVLVIGASLAALPGFVGAPVDPSHGAGAPAWTVWTAWREPRTLVIGVMVLALALTEGTANDWLAVALVDGYDAAAALAVAGFAAFVTAMTTGRMLGPVLLDRYGRVPVLWGSIGFAVVGVLLLVLGHSPVLVGVGIVAWGLGASLGFPVGMSAAADDPLRAAARVSVVSTIGYTAFLAGPPLVGFLADRVGTLESLLVVAVVLVPAALAVPSARSPLGADSVDRIRSR